VTERNLAAAARHALANLDNDRELGRNPLLCGGSLSYGTLRLIVLTALEAVATWGSGPDDRKRRRHAILVRCDLGGESHRSFIEALPISRRQFYRERREALLYLAESIEGLVPAATQAYSAATATVVDLGDAAEAYIEALRSAGQYQIVWHEASSLALRASGDPKAMEFLLVASEAARFTCDAGNATAALRTAMDLTPLDSHWQSLWLASSMMNMQWVAAECSNARATIDQNLRAGVSERTLRGKEAVLSAITLISAAFMEIDCGQWERARTLLARASSLAKNGAGAKRQSLLRLASIILRLSADVALHADGDRARALAAYRTALEAARAAGDLGTVALTAVRLAAALDECDTRQALSLADYGLEIVRRFYPGDRLAEATLSLITLLMRARGPDAALEAISRARHPSLGLRDSLFLDFAEAKVAAHSGRYDNVADRAEELRARFAGNGIDAWACDACLTAVEAYAKLGHRTQARKRMKVFADAIVCARAEARVRACELLPLVDPTMMLPA
jgi:hypothetical protein